MGMDTELEIGWSVEAPTDILARAAGAARIDRNAVVAGAADGELVYPSFFCASRSAWIKALAFLYVRNVDFRLFVFAATAAGAEAWRYRLYPGMDPSMRALMREIDGWEARRLEAVEDKVVEVFERLREAPPGDDIPAP